MIAQAHIFWSKQIIGNALTVGQTHILRKTLVMLGLLKMNLSSLRPTHCNLLFQVFVDADEAEIAPVLTKLQASWGRRVALGSYPDWLSNYHRVRLVLDSDSQGEVDNARIQLLDELPKGSVVPLVTDPVSIATAEVYSLANNGEPKTI